jgi:hypothetical protein
MYQNSHSDSRYWANGSVRHRWDEDTSMVKLTPVHVAFNAIYDKIERSIEPRIDWESGNGYFPHAVNPAKKKSYVNLYPGEVIKCMHTSKRKIIFIGTVLGTVALFEAFSPGSRNNRITLCGGLDLMATNIVRYTDLDSVVRMHSWFFGDGRESGMMHHKLRIYAEAQKKLPKRK